jgi:hypothetical protein
MFIAAVGYINDRVLDLQSFSNGHLIPIIVLGLMFLAVVGLNPLLLRLRRSVAFRSGEVALVVVLTTAACSIPGRGLMEQFHWNRVTPGWIAHRLLARGRRFGPGCPLSGLVRHPARASAARPPAGGRRGSAWPRC